MTQRHPTSTPEGSRCGDPSGGDSSGGVSIRSVLAGPGRSADRRGGLPPTGAGRGPDVLVWRWWNLLLLLPLLMLITPWFNKDSPRLFGLPFFYWYQLLFVFVGVAVVWIVHAATRTRRHSDLPLTVADKAGPPTGPTGRGATR